MNLRNLLKAKGRSLAEKARAKGVSFAKSQGSKLAKKACSTQTGSAVKKANAACNRTYKNNAQARSACHKGVAEVAKNLR